MNSRALIATIGFAAAVAPTAVHARVSSCLFDGGGSHRDRMCGAATAVTGIRAAYRRYGATASPETILSADGSNPQCANPQVRVPTPPGTLAAATASSFSESCFGAVPADASETPAVTQDVCHFWGINHGSPAGLVPFATRARHALRDRDAGAYALSHPPEVGFDAVGRKAATCNSFRFVSNSCFAGGMASIIFSTRDPAHPANNRVHPNRCGSTAAPAGHVANGYYEVNTKTGEQRIHYTHLEAFTSALSGGYSIQGPPRPGTTRAPSLDDAHFSSMTMNSDSPSTDSGVPALTSEFFLDTHFGTGMNQSVSGTSGTYHDTDLARRSRHTTAVAEITACLGAVSSATEASATATALYESIRPSLELVLDNEPLYDGDEATTPLSDGERAQIRFDLDRSTRKLALFRTNYTTSCGLDNAAYAIARAARKPAPPDRNCDFSAVYAEFQAERARRQQAVDAAVAAIATAEENICVRNWMMYSEHTCTEDNHVRPGYASLLDEVRADVTRAQNRLEEHLINGVAFRRYEEMERQLAQQVRFYREAPDDSIRQLLALRRCEMGRFDQNPPADWAALAAQLGVPATGGAAR